jgi:hypothetical protein
MAPGRRSAVKAKQEPDAERRAGQMPDGEKKGRSQGEKTETARGSRGRGNHRGPPGEAHG